MNKLVKVGKCNHCGKCCMPPLMLENCMIELHEDKCKFYIEEANKHCLIYDKGRKSIEEVKDRNGKLITFKQIKYFNENCIDYPNVKAIERGHKLPLGCGFHFEVIFNE